MPQLSPCPSCQRHVKCGETACPFCGADVGACVSSGGDGAKSIARVAAIALAAGVVASGCADGGSPQPLYGVAMDGGGDGDVDAGDDDAGGPAPEYGLPADAGE